VPVHGKRIAIPKVLDDHVEHAVPVLLIFDRAVLILVVSAFTVAAPTNLAEVIRLDVL